MWLPCGVAQVPVNEELDCIAHPLMGSYFIDEPFGVIRVAHVIEGLGIPLWKELIIVGLVSLQEVDMEGRVYPSIPELLGQLDHISRLLAMTFIGPMYFGKSFQACPLGKVRFFVDRYTNSPTSSVREAFLRLLA